MTVPAEPPFPSRQIKFLCLAARPDGLCPWLLPLRMHRLRDYEIEELRAAKLMWWDDQDRVWRTTPAGDQLVTDRRVRRDILDWRAKRRQKLARGTA